MAAWLTCLPTKRSRLAFGAPSPASESPRRVVLKALAHGMHDALRRASTPPGRPRLSRRSAQQLAESSRHWPCRSAGTAKASLNKLSRVECDQSAENDNRQRRLDLLPWTFAEHDRRNQRQAGGREAIKIGQKRSRAPRTTKSRPKDMPSSRSKCWKWLINKIWFRAATPKTVKNPINDPSEPPNRRGRLP
jgi:hypothetical protein